MLSKDSQRERLVATIARYLAFGKLRGIVGAVRMRSVPKGAPIEVIDLGWQKPDGTGFAEHAMTNHIEDPLDPTPDAVG